MTRSALQTHRTGCDTHTRLELTDEFRLTSALNTQLRELLQAGGDELSTFQQQL